ncbi:hypothetical protein [Bacillus solimangrovi]|uniref:hypothetical protein n=1 Tax=Bacillus solimangrovi TaxID=1305675 RepID=UPI0015868A20|nr:hypothetical protein [Bacillus solimangrovi]
MDKERNDLEYEGRREAFLDYDRMLNEGLAGGMVVNRYPLAQIEESSDLPLHEDPPAKC